MASNNPFESEGEPELPDVILRDHSKDGGGQAEKEPLLEKRMTPPPRYSSIGTTLPAQTDEITTNLSGTHNAGFSNPGQYLPPNVEIYPQPQRNGDLIPPTDQIGCFPRWYPYIPGATLYFPPGLEHLDASHEITITGKRSRCSIWQNDADRIFSARVSREGCFGGSKIEAQIRILNNANLDVLCLSRTQDDTTTGCCSPRSEHLEIAFPRGPVVGVVLGSKAEYTVHNPSGDLLFIIEREHGGCCGNDWYEIVTADRFGIGRIEIEKGCCGSSKTMVVAFPERINTLSKGLILSAALSIRDLHGL